MTQAPRDADGTPLPRNIGRPATDALHLAGYDRLEQLDGASAKELLRLHGVGKVAITRLREALAATGRGFRD
jgi:DNA repair protein RadC